MTAGDLILRALRLAGVLEAGETPSGAEQADSLDAFNEMMHQWDIDGIPLGWSDAAWADTLAVPDAYLRPMRLNLAVDLCAEFGVSASQELIANAIDSKRDMIEDNVQVDEVTFDVTLTNRNRFNVVSDS